MFFTALTLLESTLIAFVSSVCFFNFLFRYYSFAVCTCLCFNYSEKKLHICAWLLNFRFDFVGSGVETVVVLEMLKSVILLLWIVRNKRCDGVVEC